MKNTQWILGVIASIACIFALLITSFEIAMYSDFGWYEKEYVKYEVTEDLTMEIDDVMYVTHEMMAYLRGNRADLVVYTTIDGVENQEFFNNQDKLHMADVKNLFIGGLRFRWMMLVVMVISLLALVLTKANLKKILPKSYQLAMGITGVFTILIAVYATVDFNRFFTRFHEIFFTNDLWLFDPATDYMIRMLPENFFADMVLRIGILFILSVLILLAISIICDKYFQKKNLTIGEDRG